MTLRPGGVCITQAGKSVPPPRKPAATDVDLGPPVTIEQAAFEEREPADLAMDDTEPDDVAIDDTEPDDLPCFFML